MRRRRRRITVCYYVVKYNDFRLLVLVCSSRLKLKLKLKLGACYLLFVVSMRINQSISRLTFHVVPKSENLYRLYSHY